MRIKLLLLTVILLYVCIYMPAFSIGDKDKSKEKDSLQKKSILTKGITVSGLRQPENNLEVPLSITILSAIDLQNKRGLGLDDMLSNVPGLLVQSRSGNQDLRLTIRGFGARGSGERSNAGTTRGIRVLVDGIPETEPDGRTALDFIDPAALKSAEILRSNSSALFGNASGGIISFSTIPQTDKTILSLSSQIGSFGLQKTTFQASTKTDIGLLYCTIGRNSFDGWREHSQSNAFQFSGGLVNQINQRTKTGLFILAGNTNFKIPGPLNQVQFDSNPQQSADTSTFNPTFIQRDERRNNTAGRLGFTIDHALSQDLGIGGMAYLQSKFLQRSERNTFRDFTRYHTGGNIVMKHTMQYSEEIHQMFIGGVDYQYQDGSILFYSLINGERGDILRTNKREGAENIGVFLQDEILFGEQISLIIGARYDNISYFTDIYVDGALPVYKNEMKSFERVTPKAGLTWKLQNDMSVYANLGGGIEVPAGNETDPPASLSSYIINPLLQPIQSLSLEAGYKCDLILDNYLLLGKARIKGDLAIYTISTENDIIPYSGGRFYFSAGKTKRTGIECSHSAQWENGLTISASLTLSSNVYTEYKQDSIVNGNPTGASYTDYAQNSIAGIPNSYGSFKIQYTPTSFSEFSCNAEIRNMSTYFANDANTLKVDAYSTIDIGIMYNVEISNNLELKIFGKVQNLLDIQYAAGVWINPDIPKFTSPAYLEPGLPRNIVIGTSLNWTN